MTDPLDTKRTQRDSGTDGKILVVIQMSGGNDGLSMVCPYADDAYHRARPTLGKKADDVLKLNNYIGLNKNLGPIKSLYDDGMATLIQGVGYPNPNRSHFRSMDIWHTAEPDKETSTSGWLGRYFDNTCGGNDPHNTGSAAIGGVAGIAIGGQAPLAMKGEKTMPLSFDRPENYRYNGNDKADYKKLNSETGINVSADQAPPKPSVPPTIAKKQPTIITPGSQLEFLTRTSMDAQVSSDKILDIVGNYHTNANYPTNDFGRGLKTTAAMIRGGLPTRVYYVSMGGYDTHAGQEGRHDNLMRDFAQGVSAFMQDMKDQKNDDRVCVMCFSEFGRRVEQNASGGTDHGAAAPMFVFGRGISKHPGIVGEHPSLTQLDGGDLIHKIDFRSVYASVLQDWLGTASKPILGDQFKTMPIFKA